MLASLLPSNMRALYAGFNTPLADLDCGQKCAPYNGGIPFCCDIHHAVPTAYPGEWIYLRSRTNLWQVWRPDDEEHRAEIQADAGDLILLECLMLTGTQHPERSGNELNHASDSILAQSKDAGLYCRRDLRTLVCRAFPFFPYFNRQGDLLGLSVYWEYADRCWIISNLQVVRPEFRDQFIQTYENLFAQMPTEREAFQYHSEETRRVAQERRRTIPLLHRDGHAYKISPATEKMHRLEPDRFPKHGPYKIADALLFPDEV
ncbi:MAG: hypothetical protein Fur0022_11600 [Anaerolineales bacterium]